MESARKPGWSRPKDREAVSAAFAILAALIILVAAISIPLIFLNYRDIRIQERKEVPFQEGIDNATITVLATKGDLNVSFENLNGPMVVLEATVLGKAGFFGNTGPLNMTLNHSVENRTLKVDSWIDTYGPWPFYTLSRTNYNLIIDTSLRSSVNVSMTTGGIKFNASSGVVLEGVHLEATSSGVKMNMTNVSLAGDVYVKTATGGTNLTWENLILLKDVMMELRESSGPITMDIVQASELQGNVTIKSATTAGLLTLNLEIRGGSSALVKSNSGVGALNILDKTGFNGTSATLQSINYPSLHSFNTTLNTTVGGIDIAARYK